MDFQIFGCFEKLMTSTLQKTQREAKIDGQIKNCAGKQFATPPPATLSVAGFRSDNGMCFNQFALFTIFESIIYRVYGMIYHLRTGDRSLTSLNLLLTNFRVNRSKTEIVSQKTVYRFQNSWGRLRLP